MWNCDRKVFTVLLSLLVGNVVGSLTYQLLIYKVIILSHSLFSPNGIFTTHKRFVILDIPTSQRLPGNTGCAVLNAGGHFWVVFTLSLTYECEISKLSALLKFILFSVVIVLFTIVWAILQFRNGLARRHTPLTNSLYKTGVIYFVIMASVMAFMSATGITPVRYISNNYCLFLTD